MSERAQNDLRDLLNETLRLEKENNAMLRTMRRNAALGFWFKVLFYMIIIGLPILVYRYYVAEYVDDVRATYSELKKDASTFGLPIPESMQRLLEKPAAVE